MQVNFFEYLEVVYEALDRVSPYCNVMITNAIQELELMFEENNYESFQGINFKNIYKVRDWLLLDNFKLQVDRFKKNLFHL